MKNLFEFLYYCIYRMFTLIKRVGEKDENIASNFYSCLLSTYTVILFFPFRYIFPIGYFKPILNNLILKLTMVGVFFIWYLICRNYFLRKRNYIRILKSYDKKYVGKTQVLAIIGVTFSFLTFLTFIIIAAKI